MKFREYFKEFSDIVQFLSAFITLVSYLTIGPQLPALIGRIMSHGEAPELQKRQLIAVLGPFNGIVVFGVVLCLVFILLNIVLSRSGVVVHFVKWRRTYRILSAIIVFLLVLWFCDVTYVVFFGGAFVWAKGTLWTILAHSPWCYIYVLLSVVLGGGTLLRVKMELEDEEKRKPENRDNHAWQVWEPSW